MEISPIKTLILMIVLSTILFLLEIYVPYGVISSMYVLIVLLSSWSKDDKLTLIFTTGSIILVFLSYFINYDTIIWQVMINKFLASFVILISGLLIIKKSEIEKNILNLKETLELRVLARTAASEVRSAKLEQQIELLQILRNNSTDNSFKQLDMVIDNLKELSIKEKNG